MSTCINTNGLWQFQAQRQSHEEQLASRGGDFLVAEEATRMEVRVLCACAIVHRNSPTSFALSFLNFAHVALGNRPWSSGGPSIYHRASTRACMRRDSAKTSASLWLSGSVSVAEACGQTYDDLAWFTYCSTPSHAGSPGVWFIRCSLEHLWRRSM